MSGLTRRGAFGVAAVVAAPPLVAAEEDGTATANSSGDNDEA